MKNTLRLLLIVLVIMTIAYVFYLGKNNSDTSSSSTSSTKSASAIQVLDLSNKNLTQATADIYGKTATTELILSHNSIRTLPGEMGKMKNVVVFRIDHNLLDGSLIGEIRHMSQLRTLDVSDNNMTGVPAEIGQLSNLISLNYSNNHITGLPNELARLKNNLKEFNLTGNPLSKSQIETLKIALPNTTIIF